MKRATALLSLLLPLAACEQGTSGPAAKELVQKGAALLDVRTVEEFESGALPGAINIPVQELYDRLPTAPFKKEQDIVVYCQSGNRSATAASVLKREGYLKVHDLGAMSNWR